MYRICFPMTRLRCLRLHKPAKPGRNSNTVDNLAPTYETTKAAIEALERKHGKRSALWTYHNANGDPVGVIVRWDKAGGKDIRRPAR